MYIFGKRRRCIGFTLFAALTFTNPLLADAPPPMEESEITISGIKRGATAAQIKKILGELIRKEKYSWFYPGLEISFINGIADQYFITSPKYATTRGVRVGDPSIKYYEAYGKNSMMPGFYCAGQFVSTETRCIDFKSENGKIVRIIIGMGLDLN